MLDLVQREISKIIILRYGNESNTRSVVCGEYNFPNGNINSLI